MRNIRKGTSELFYERIKLKFMGGVRQLATNNPPILLGFYSSSALWKQLRSWLCAYSHALNTNKIPAQSG